MINFKTFEAGIRIAPNSSFAADPVAGKVGQIYWNTTRQVLRICINDAPTTWQDLFINPSPTNDATLRWDTANDRWDYNPDLLISSTTIYAADNSDADAVDANDLTLTAASKTAGTALGGDVIIQPGTGTSGDGKTILNGDRIFIGAQSATNPSTSVEGDLYYNTSNKKIRYYDGTAWVEVTTNNGTQILENKTIGDTNTISAQDDAFSIQDASDPTLQVLFDVAGTTGTSTTILSSQTGDIILTLPNITDTLVTKNTQDIFTNKTIGDSNTINAQDDAFSIQDATDNTKQILFDVAGGALTSTTLLSSQTVDRILTLPDITDTLVTRNTIDVLTNKTIGDTNTINAQDDAFSVQDAADSTKQILFDAAGTTGTSTTLLSSQTTDRVLTLPDATDTLVGKDTDDILTNKTLSKLKYDEVDIALAGTIAKPDETIIHITGTTGNIDAITGGSDGDIKILTNETGGVIFLTEDAGANGFHTGIGIDLQIKENGSVQLIYEAAVSRWRVIGGGGSGNGTIKADLYDPVSTSLPAGVSATIDGQALVDGDRVLFSNLAINNNKIYEASGVGVSIAWTPIGAFQDNLETPTDGDIVVIARGAAFADQQALFNGTDFRVNDVVRYFDGANGTDYWEQSSLKTSTLTDNTVNGVVFDVNVTGSENWIIDYSLTRGAGVKETGQIYMTSDGSAVAIAQNSSFLGSSGVSFDADINTGNIRLLYTTSSSGSNATMKYITKRWSNSAGGPGGIPNYSGFTGGTTTAAGSTGDVQFKGGSGSLDATAQFKWDSTEEAINLDGLYVHKLQGPNILLDGQVTAQPIVSLSASNYRHAVIEYSLVRNGDFQTGRMLLVNDGSQAFLSDDNIATAGSLGVNFSSDISGGNVRILYTSTNTGSNASFKFNIRNWS